MSGPVRTGLAFLRIGANPCFAEPREGEREPRLLDLLFEQQPSATLRDVLCQAEDAGLIAAAREARRHGADLTEVEVFQITGVMPDLDLSARGRLDPPRPWGEPERKVEVTQLWQVALALAEEPELIFTPRSPAPSSASAPGERLPPRVRLSAEQFARLSPDALILLGRIYQLIEARLTGVEAGARLQQRAEEGLHADPDGNRKQKNAETQDAAEEWIGPACVEADDLRAKNPALRDIEIARRVRARLKARGITCRPRRKDGEPDAPSVERIRKVLRVRGRERKSAR